MTSYLEKWQVVADDFITVCLTVESARLDAVVDHGLAMDDLPEGEYLGVYRAIAEIRIEKSRAGEESLTLPVSLVASRCKASVEWIAFRLAGASHAKAREFGHICEQLKLYAAGHRQLLALRKGDYELKTALDNGVPFEAVTDNVIISLKQDHTAAPKVSTAAINDDIDQAMESDPEPGIMTGIMLVDEWLRGLSPGNFIGWVGPYKSRKTRIMLNVLLKQARDNRVCDVFSLDEKAEQLNYKLRSMLMAEYLWNEKMFDRRLENGTALNAVDWLTIRRAGKNWRNWPAPLQRAYEYAADSMRKVENYLHIHTADTLPAMRRQIETTSMRYGKTEFAFIDHLQKMGGKGTIFERTEDTTKESAKLAFELDVVLWMLSQQNEEAVKGNDSAWSPNAKGGGGFGSNVDAAFVSKGASNLNGDPRFVQIELRVSRNTESQQKGYVEMHPQSGWILPRPVDVKLLNVNDIVNGAKAQSSVYRGGE